MCPCVVFPFAALALALGGPPQPAGAEGGPAVRDVQLAMHARRALRADEQLGPLNLSVQVRYGVATVWGPVPSKGLAERASRVLAKVQGIYEVRSELYVAPRIEDEKALRDFLAGLSLSPEAPPAEPLFPAPRPERGSGSLGLLSDRPGLSPPQEVSTARPDLRLPEPDEPEPPRPVVSLLPPVGVVPERAATEAAVTLLTPRAHVDPVMTSRGTGAGADPELREEAERLRGGDVRYREVRVEVRDGVVALSGRVAEREHVMDLATALSRLPGVRQVDTTQVKAGR
jgi:hypothetical protein